MHGFSFLVSLKLTPFSRFIYIAISLIFSPFRRTASRENAAVRHFGNGGREEEREETAKCISVQAFSFADSYDCVLMTLGSIGACIHGASVPVFFIFFGKLINIIGLAYLFPQEASHKVAKVISIFS